MYQHGTKMIPKGNQKLPKWCQRHPHLFSMLKKCAQRRSIPPPKRCSEKAGSGTPLPGSPFFKIYVEKMSDVGSLLENKTIKSDGKTKLKSISEKKRKEKMLARRGQMLLFRLTCYTIFGFGGLGFS